MSYLKFALGFPVWFIPALCLADSTKIAPDVAQDGPGVVDVIIQFQAQPAEAHAQKLANLGGRLVGNLGIIRAAKYSLPPAAIRALSDDPDVFYISPDRQVTVALDNASPASGAAVAFQSGLTGTGVGIAIIDSGILEVRDLLGPSTNAANLSRIAYSESFVAKTTSTADQYGHGTHVAGAAAGNANSSTGSSYIKSFRGVAPNATLINLRVLDAKGVGTDSAVIAAIDRAISLKNKYNIRVINLSLGRPVYQSC